MKMTYFPANSMFQLLWQEIRVKLSKLTEVTHVNCQESPQQKDERGREREVAHVGNATSGGQFELAFKSSLAMSIGLQELKKYLQLIWAYINGFRVAFGEKCRYLYQ